MENLRNESLKVRNEVVNDLNKISNLKFYINYNDLYKVKNGEVRRLKGCFGEWLLKSDWVEFKKELEKINYGDDFKIEFNCVNKLMSVGGKKEVEYNRESWVNDNMGSYEEFDDIFNSKDYMFIIKIIYKS